MGSFNILITEIKCPGCGKKTEAHIQFKYANTWQHSYKIGDTIQWSGTRYDNVLKDFQILENPEDYLQSGIDGGSYVVLDK